MKRKTGRHLDAAAATVANFGFTIRSPYAFRFLRTGGGSGSLKICDTFDYSVPPTNPPLLQWTLQGSYNVSAKLYAEGDSYRYWISDAGWYDINPTAGTICIPCDGDDLFREQRLWGVPTLLCAMHRGDFFLHAAAAEVNGTAILFAGPGRHGKTTLAMAFHREGYRVISEDSACCRLGHIPSVLPGPALLRLRPDVYKGCPPSGTSVVCARDDRIYLAIDPDRRGSDDPIPIRGIVFLRESAETIHIEPVPSHKALPDLWALTFHFPGDADRARCFKQLTNLVSSTSCWNLYRPLRLASLSATVERIVDKITSAPLSVGS